MSKHKAKTAVLVAVAAKPEVEIWRRPQKWTLWPWFPIHSFRRFFARTHRFATIQNVTDDRQTRHCTNGSTDSTVGQKPWVRRPVWRWTPLFYVIILANLCSKGLKSCQTHFTCYYSLACLPETFRLSSSVYHLHCRTFDPFRVIFTFHVPIVDASLCRLFLLKSRMVCLAAWLAKLEHRKRPLNNWVCLL